MNFGQIKKLGACIIPLALMLTACSNKSSEYNFTYVDQTARKIMDDGWVYSFTYSYSKNSEDEYSYPYIFSGLNLRYRYSDDYMTEVSYVDKDTKELVVNKVYDSFLILGECEKDAADMEKIDELLQDSSTTNEKLLSLTAEDLSFESVDGQLFLDLAREAINAEPHEEGKYGDLPSYAMFTEQNIDDVSFQVGFITDMGCIDVVYIDVLYWNGTGEREYIQLSDMVDDGSASADQKELFQTLKDISDGMVSENDLLYGMDSYESSKYDGISLGRLYEMLENIGKLDYEQYVI